MLQHSLSSRANFSRSISLAGPWRQGVCVEVWSKRTSTSAIVNRFTGKERKGARVPVAWVRVRRRKLQLLLLGVPLEELGEDADPSGQPVQLVCLHLLGHHALEARDLRGELLLCRAKLGLNLGNKGLFLFIAALQRLWLTPRRRLRVTLDLDDLHLKDEDVAALDLGRGPAVAIAELRWDVHLPLVSFDHQLHCFGPALDHLVWRKGGGGAPLVRRIEDGAVNQLAFVVAFARR
mmetsp:Transcript_16188/g.47855  ORF Transcript_16188/g.47855 Transcript_16188/m.47855 type:complete len:235 (+) Transcript_16188:1738-2442(+)